MGKSWEWLLFKAKWAIHPYHGETKLHDNDVGFVLDQQT